MSPEPSRKRRGVVTVERVVVWGLAALAIAGLAAVAVGPGADLRAATPAVDIDSQFDAETGTVTLTHVGGDRLTDTSTHEVRVVVTDADRNQSTSLVWADGNGLPLEAGAQFTVDDPRVDADGDGDYLDGDASVGFYLDAGDTLSVRWTGRPLGAPSVHTTTLDTVTLSNETA